MTATIMNQSVSISSSGATAPTRSIYELLYTISALSSRSITLIIANHDDPTSGTIRIPTFQRRPDLAHSVGTQALPQFQVPAHARFRGVLETRRRSRAPYTCP